MALGIPLELATDGRFREVAGFGDPPRAGVVTEVLPSGQVRVDMDDPDGGDVLAWPLNGFAYGVGDVVYVAFAANSPDGGVVLGAKAPLPALDAVVFAHDHSDKVARDGSTPLTADWDIGNGRKLRLQRIDARDGGGIAFYDDGGNLVLFLADGGKVGVNTGAPNAFATMDIEGSIRAAGGFFIDRLGGNLTHYLIANCRAAGQAGAFGNALGSGAAELYTYGMAGLVLGTYDATPLAFGTNNVVGMFMDSARQVGWGTGTPKGKAHWHDGTGGMIFVTKTGIGTTAVTILPNGSGDVTKALAFLIAISDGNTGGAAVNFLFPGGNQDFAVGTLTVRLSCAADGSLTVKRQAGTGTATVALVGVWI